jgi:HSP20 family protein
MEQQRPDQERSREVTRDRAGTAGSGMQRAGARETGRDVSPRRSGPAQPTLLPALMANPGLMTRAFMSNPFAFAQAMNEEMDRLFSMAGRGELGQQVGQTGQQGVRSAAEWAPPIEIVQQGNDLVVRADLPGLKPDDVRIEIEDHVLTISGERRERQEDRRDGFYRSERSYGSFTRSLTLPEGVNEDQVTANFEHGELEVRIPLPDQQRSRGRRVQIQSGGTGASQQRGAQSSGAAQSGTNGS